MWWGVHLIFCKVSFQKHPSQEISTHLDYDENEASEGKQCAEDNDCDCCEAKVIILIINGAPGHGAPGELCEGRFWIIFLSDI